MAFNFIRQIKDRTMIKRMVLMAIIFIMVCGFSIGSGEKTSDGSIASARCYISSVQIITDGTNDAKLILYDNASAASGTVITEMTVTGTGHFGGRYWAPERLCINGIYADITGTGASYIVEYSY